MVRVLVIDDHPALRAGLEGLLRSEPGLLAVGGIGHAREALDAIDRLDPDVVLLDYRLPEEDGLSLCLRIKARADAPKVVIYSAHSTADLALPATLAGADAVVAKSALTDELLETVKLVARGKRLIPAIASAQLERGLAVIEPEDAPILSMIQHGTPKNEIAETLKLDRGDVSDRIRAMLGKLQEDAMTAPSR